MKRAMPVASTIMRIAKRPWDWSQSRCRIRKLDWTALIGFAVIPFYVKYLGHEGYGLIGFLVTAQAVLQVSTWDSRPTSTARSPAKRSPGDLSGAPALLHTAATIYWAMAGVIALAMLALVTFYRSALAELRDARLDDLAYAVMLIGLVIAARWPGQLYQGALMGAQRIVVSSALNIALATLGSGGAVLVLAFVSPSVSALLLWQLEWVSPTRLRRARRAGGSSAGRGSSTTAAS